MTLGPGLGACLGSGCGSLRAWNGRLQAHWEADHLKIQVWASPFSLRKSRFFPCTFATLAQNRQKGNKLDKIDKIGLGPGLGRLPQVGAWLATGMECPTLVGTGVEWRLQAHLEADRLNIQVRASAFSFRKNMLFPCTFATWAPNRQKDSKIDNIYKMTLGPGLGRLPQVGVWLATGMEWSPPGPLGSGTLKNPSSGESMFLKKKTIFFLAHFYFGPKSAKRQQNPLWPCNIGLTKRTKTRVTHSRFGKREHLCSRLAAPGCVPSPLLLGQTRCHLDLKPKFDTSCKRLNSTGPNYRQQNKY